MTKASFTVAIFLFVSSLAFAADDPLAKYRSELASPDEKTRLRAVQTLSRALKTQDGSREEAIDLLLPLLGDPMREVRTETLNGLLGLSGEDETVHKDPAAAVRKLVKSDEFALRRAGMAAAHWVDVKLVLSEVPPLLAEKDPKVRMAALDSLKVLTEGGITKWAPRRPAWYGLQPEVGRPGATAVARLKEDEDERVRAAAATIEKSFLTLAKLEALKITAESVDDRSPEALKDQPPIKLTDKRNGRLSAWAQHGDLVAVGYYYNSIRRGEDGTKRGYVHFYNAQTGRRIGVMADNYGPVHTLKFSEDGAELHCQLGKYEEVGGK